jgi:hypothetical protein
MTFAFQANFMDSALLMLRLREMHRASAELVWTFVGGRC